MRQSRYLNVILTVNAVLLAGLLWTQVVDRPMLAETGDRAVAQHHRHPAEFRGAAQASARRNESDASFGRRAHEARQERQPQG